MLPSPSTPHFNPNPPVLSRPKITLVVFGLVADILRFLILKFIPANLSRYRLRGGNRCEDNFIEAYFVLLFGREGQLRVGL